MNKKERKKIQVQTVNDVSELGQYTKEKLIAESEQYDLENYNPTDPKLDKSFLIPRNRSEVITIRLTPQENEVITSLANANGLSKSAFVRMVVKRSLNEKDFYQS